MTDTVNGKVAVTGATGHLGRLVVDGLLEKGVQPQQIAAIARSEAKAIELKEKGVDVRIADYTDPASLTDALNGVDKLLLISSNEVGQRFAQHTNVVDAAKTAGVKLIAYTSLTRADTSGMQLAAEHKQTEEFIKESGLPYVILRNGWYIENYEERAAASRESGVFVGAGGDGHVSGATRADYAAAAAAVLTGEGHENQIYELGGDTSFTLSELTEVIAKAAGREIEYRDVSAEEYEKALAGSGLPEPVAAMVADFDAGTKRGDVFTSSGELGRLIGRPTTSIAEFFGRAADPRKASHSA